MGCSHPAGPSMTDVTGVVGTGVAVVSGSGVETGMVVGVGVAVCMGAVWILVAATPFQEHGRMSADGALPGIFSFTSVRSSRVN